MNSFFTLQLATDDDLAWARQVVSSYHYLHKSPDVRSRAIAYVVRLCDRRVGCLFFGRPESTRCYAGGLTYGSVNDVRIGRARFDRWEILNLSRVWLSPEVQSCSSLCNPECVPGYHDRNGVWRSTLASEVIHAAIATVGFDYLKTHPPCFVDQPFQIRVILSYCNTSLHRGAIYRASGFHLARRNAAGIETWFTTSIASLATDQDQHIRSLAQISPRSRRIRDERRSLFDEGVFA